MKFKRILALFLALIAVFNLSACRQNGSSKNTPAPTQDIIDLPTARPTDAPMEKPTDAPVSEASNSELPSSAEPATEAPTLTATPSEKPTEAPSATPKPTEVPNPTEAPVREDGVYDSKDEVALYIHLFGHLPSNYITKKEAQALGWSGGSLEKYAPGKCIGGDRFGNYEGALPNANGRKYTECDIGTLGKSSRGAKRIVFSNDGLIYYTDDHYETFTLLYGGND